MKQSLKRIFALAYPASYKEGLLILNYHSIHPSNPFSTHPCDFEEQLRFLSSSCKVIPLRQAREASLENGVSMVITFDDGYFDNYQYAYPLLKKYSVPATIFVTTDFVFSGLDIARNWKEYSGLKPLSPDAMREMAHEGLVSFGSHTRTHAQSATLSDGQFFEEASSSKKALESFLGIEVLSFAYPYGQKSDYRSLQKDILREAGYAFACTTQWGINRPEAIDWLNLKRIRIDHDDSLSDFKKKILGKWDFVGFVQDKRSIRRP